MAIKPDCCQKKKSCWKNGLLYGLLPHTFCLAFLIFSILGATTLTAFFRRWLLTPYFFPLLIFLSLLFATLSSVFYLKKNQLLSLEGIKKKTSYLLLLYFSIISVNLLFFLVIFPLTANLNSKKSEKVLGQKTSSVILKVEIPCSGHAPLIIDEMNKVEGITSTIFILPNLFEISYDSQKISLTEILSLEIFKNFKAKIV